MNLQQAKALFFAHYYGQKVLRGNTQINGEWIDETFNDHKSLVDFLLLKPIAELTDEHAMRLAMLLDSEAFNMDDEIAVQRFPDFIFMYSNNEQIDINFNSTEGLFTNKDSYNFNSDSLHQCYQLLIRWGYLIAFTYIDDAGQPVTLSPEEIIGNGWAKYQTA